MKNEKGIEVEEMEEVGVEVGVDGDTIILTVSCSDHPIVAVCLGDEDAGALIAGIGKAIEVARSARMGVMN